MRFLPLAAASAVAALFFQAAPALAAAHDGGAPVAVAAADSIPQLVPAIIPAFPQAAQPQAAQPQTDPDEDQAQAPVRHNRPSLADLVYESAASTTPDEESECLARAVYWESKGEPLEGQLAVARVIINRAQSGRFAPTLCGVVRQRSQFSFVHGGNIPAAPQGAREWQTAVAIAHIAEAHLADCAASEALFFHARYVHPAWRLTRIAALGNHIFYR
jgi:spore germination cell wall hydrolase CwlJ-like protein